MKAQGKLHWVLRLLISGIALAAGVLPASAQFSSTIEGTVSDASGAIIRGATVTIRNEDTGIVYSSASNDTGVFRAPNLPGGSYRVEIQSPGFRLWVQPNLKLGAAEARTLNASLQVGVQAEAVEVVANITSVETAKSNVGTEISEKTIEQAPLLGRNVYSSLVALAPGMTGGITASSDNFATESSYNVYAAGQRKEHNEYQLDGTSMVVSSAGGKPYVTPEPDTVEAVKVTTADFSADKGRFSGGTVQVFSKPGTNTFHGTLSEYHQNNKLTARTRFQTSLPVSRRNEFGGTLGGPVVRNRTFFFGSLFALRSSVGTGGLSTVETPEFRQFITSNFPKSIATEFFKSAPPASEPTMSFQTVAQVAALNPGRLPVPSIFPKDMKATGTAVLSYSVPRNGHQWNGRFDHNLTNSDRLFYSVYRTYGTSMTTNARELYRVTQVDTGLTNKVNWIRTFSPSILNEASMSWIRTTGGVPVNRFDLPTASITGTTGFSGSWGPAFWIHNDFAWREVLSIVRGGHNIRTGLEVDRQRDDDPFTGGYTLPSFTFDSLFDFVQDYPTTQTGPTIDTRTGKTATGLNQRIRMLYMAPFVQDDWKVSRTLTVNLGVRYEDFGHLSAVKNDRDPIPQFQPAASGTPQQQVANGSMVTMGGDKGWGTEDRVAGFAFRLGLGWDVLGDGRLAIRGGWGTYYNKLGSLVWISRLNPPTWAQTSASILDPNARLTYMLGPNYLAPIGANIQVDSRGGIVGTRVAAYGVVGNMDPPRTQTWMASIQRALGRDITAELDYNGTHSDRQLIISDVNRFAGDLIQNNGKLTRLNSSFGSINLGRSIGVADSHLGTLMLNKRFGNNWSTRALFTFGKATDYVSGYETGGVRSAGQLVDAFNPALKKGRSDYDVSRRLAWESVVGIPAPWKTGWQSRLLADWTLTAIGVWAAGAPFSVVTNASYPTGDFNADGFNSDFPNTATWGNSAPMPRQSLIGGQAVLRRADFPSPPLGQEGDLGRNTFTGPTTFEMNASLTKSVRVPWFSSDGAAMQLRGEFFNVFNVDNPSRPENRLNNSLFGTSTGQGMVRTIQLGLRFSF
jgi:hypothetical protein